MEIQMRLETWKLADLKPAEYNPRKRLTPEDKEYQDLRRSLEELDYSDPIVINTDGTIIKGHQRCNVMMDMGREEADVVVLDIPDKAKEKALNIALNKITGKWDDDLLKQALVDLDLEGYDFSVTGYKRQDLEDLIRLTDIQPEAQEDDFDREKAAAEVQTPESRPGDIWSLGRHRLMCGDATDPGDIYALLGGDKLDLVITDPPYNVDYGGKNEFLLSLCEQLVGSSARLSAKEKSIIDRCTAQCYREYIRGGYRGQVPTLQNFHATLLSQPEEEARDVALAIELFTEGSLNTFAKPTNVDTNSRILCYDIRDLGKQLLPVGMLVVLDSVFNRIIRNRMIGKGTWLYIDEIYLLFQHEYSANFLFTLWKRVRKYGACCTGVTQNVDVRPDRVLCKAV